MTLAFALVRAVHLAGLMTMFGASVFAALAGLRRETLRRTLAWACVAALVPGALSLCFVTAQMTGVPAAATDFGSLSTVVTQTAYGHVFVVRIGLLVFLIVLQTVGAGTWMKAVVAGAALGLLGLNGHAASAVAPSYEYVFAASDALHLLTAGFWIGGMVALLPGVLAKAEDGTVLIGRLKMFSRWGMAAVAILVLSGAANAIAILDMRGMAWSTAYMSWLSAKLVLAGLMIALALTNRFGILPGLERGEAEAADTLPLTLFLELGSAALILLIVAILGLTAPMQM